MTPEQEDQIIAMIKAKSQTLRQRRRKKERSEGIYRSILMFSQWKELIQDAKMYIETARNSSAVKLLALEYAQTYHTDIQTATHHAQMSLRYEAAACIRAARLTQNWKNKHSKGKRVRSQFRAYLKEILPPVPSLDKFKALLQAAGYDKNLPQTLSATGTKLHSEEQIRETINKLVAANTAADRMKALAEIRDIRLEFVAPDDCSKEGKKIKTAFSKYITTNIRAMHERAQSTIH